MRLFYLIFSLILMVGCATKSKVPFHPAPKPDVGYGLIYIFNEGDSKLLNNISSIYLKPLTANTKEAGVSAYLVAGEYTWVHLKPGVYSAMYRHPGSGRLISTPVIIESEKTNYLKILFSPGYVLIKNVPESIALKKISNYKYWKYEKKECTLVVNCR